MNASDRFARWTLAITMGFHRRIHKGRHAYPDDAMGRMNDAVLAILEARASCDHTTEANDGLCSCANEAYQQRRVFKVRHPNLVTTFDRLVRRER